MYFYAEKYGIDSMKSKIISRLLSETMLYDSKSLQSAIDMANLYNLDYLKKKLDSVKLDLDNYAIGLWNLVSKLNMKNHMTSIARFLEPKEVNRKWPLELIFRIMAVKNEKNSELKVELEKRKNEYEKELKQEMGRTAYHEKRYEKLRSKYMGQKWYCTHGAGKKYKRIKNCQPCREELEEPN